MLLEPVQFPQYQSAIKGVLDNGQLPQLCKIDGEVFCGTTSSEAQAIIQTGKWTTPLWLDSWMGPCVHCFENREPDLIEYSGSTSHHLGKLWALNYAAKEISEQNSSEEPAIIAVQVNCNQVLNLESAENDPFMSALQTAFRPIADEDGQKSALAEPRFIGRILHSNLALIPEANRPTSFQLRYYSHGIGLCWSLAIVDTRAIFNPRIIPLPLA